MKNIREYFCNRGNDGFRKNHILIMNHIVILRIIKEDIISVSEENPDSHFVKKNSKFIRSSNDHVFYRDNSYL